MPAVQSPKGSPKVGTKARNNKIVGALNIKQAEFARQMLAGKTQIDSYRLAYLPADDANQETLSVLASRVARRPAVVAEIARLRTMIDRRRLLTLNERLEILGGRIRDPNTKSSDLAQLTAVYSRISGDQAPERHEVTGADGGAMQVEISAGPLVRRLSARERLAEMKRVREERDRPIELLPAAMDPLENAS